MVDDHVNNDRLKGTFFDFLTEVGRDAQNYGPDRRSELNSMQLDNGAMVDISWQNAHNLRAPVKSGQKQGDLIFPESDGWNYTAGVAIGEFKASPNSRTTQQRHVGWLARGADNKAELDTSATTRVFFHGSGNSYVSTTPEAKNINLFRTSFLTSAPKDQNVIAVDLQRHDTYGKPERDAQLKALAQKMLDKGLSKIEIIGESLGSIEAIRFAAIAQEMGLEVQSVTGVAAPKDFARTTKNYLDAKHPNLDFLPKENPVKFFGPNDNHSSIDSMKALKASGYQGPLTIVRTMLEDKGRPDSYVFQRDQQEVTKAAKGLFGAQFSEVRANISHTNYDYNVLQTMIQSGAAIADPTKLKMPEADAGVIDSMKARDGVAR